MNCGKCIACCVSSDCGKCDNCRSNALTGRKQICRLRRCIAAFESINTPPTVNPSNGGFSRQVHHNVSSSSEYSEEPVSEESDDERDSTSSNRRPSSAANKSNRRPSVLPSLPNSNQATNTGRKNASANSSNRRRLASSVMRGKNKKRFSKATTLLKSSAIDRRDVKPAVQCLGPGCILSARSDSKYCSNECGLKLAEKRLNTFLPARVEEWLAQQPTILMDLDRESLRSLDAQMKVAIQRLVEKENELRHLSNLVSHVRTLHANEKNMHIHDPSESNDQSSGDSVHCVCCGHEINIKIWLKHVERCYQKIESKTLYYANLKENPMGSSLFCDEFDQQTLSYCKRLKALCEHTKEPKLPNDALCGFPLTSNVFTETGKYCPILRRKCWRHTSWERLRRANIDLQRFKLLNYVEQLGVRKRIAERRIQRRPDLAGILLHSTKPA